MNLNNIRLFVIGLILTIGYPMEECRAQTDETSERSSAMQLIDSLEKYPSEILLSNSNDWMVADTLTNQTVAALTVVTNRYLQNQSDTTARRHAIRAMQMLGNLYGQAH